MTASKRGKTVSKLPTTATQKLEYLVKKYASLELAIERLTRVMAEENQKLSLENLDIKKSLNAVIETSKEGVFSFDKINSKYEEISNKVQTEIMKSDIAEFVKAGALIKSEDGKVTEKSFIIGRELNEDKSVSVERLQFTYESIDKEDVKKKTLGASVGDLIEFGNEVKKGFLEITEIYNISEKVTSK